MGINIKKAKDVTKSNEINLKLKEEYTDKIVKLKTYMEKVFATLSNSGTKIDYSNILNELEQAKKLKQDYNKTNLFKHLEIYKPGSGKEVFSLISNFAFDEAVRMISDIFPYETKYNSPSSLMEFLSHEAHYLVNKYNLDLKTLISLSQEDQHNIEAFKKLYAEIINMSSNNRGIFNAEQITEWMDKASNLFSGFTSFFNKNTKQKNKASDSQTSWFSGFFSSPKNQDAVKPQEVKSSWSLSLNPLKWFNNAYSKSQGTDQNNETSKTSSIDLGDDSVNKQIHTYYHSLVTYGYTSAKATCFAQVITNIQKLSNDCAIGRTSNAEEKFYNKNTAAETKESMAIIEISKTSNAVAVSDSKPEDFSANCEKLIASYYQLAENCNYIFSDDSSVDEQIETALAKAATVNTNFNEKGELVLLSSDGFEVHMTHIAKEYTEENFNLAIEYSTNAVQQIAGSDNNLAIEL